MCETYHALPSSGGILDQDSYIVYGLQAVLSGLAIKADKEKKSSKAPRIR